MPPSGANGFSGVLDRAFLIRMRTGEGRSRAKAQGRPHMGPVSALTSQQAAAARQRCQDGATLAGLAKGDCRVSVTSMRA